MCVRDRKGGDERMKRSIYLEILSVTLSLSLLSHSFSSGVVCLRWHWWYLMSPQAMKLMTGNLLLYPICPQIKTLYFFLSYVFHLHFTKLSHTVFLWCVDMSLLLVRPEKVKRWLERHPRCKTVGGPSPVHNVFLSLRDPRLATSGFFGRLVHSLQECVLVLLLYNISHVFL